MTIAASHAKLLLVTMPSTPGQEDLPGVTREAKTISDTMSGSTVKALVKPEVKTVVDELPSYDIVHFACHGYTDPMSPLRSGLPLCGDEPARPFNKNTRNSTLTVERISSMDTRQSQLAFLSACCTAENASPELMDEVIHLASGFQLTGFPHVIASLWEADDDLAEAMTERFYQNILGSDDVSGHKKIACALHDAVFTARQICDSPLSWATIIHFGP